MTDTPQEEVVISAAMTDTLKDFQDDFVLSAAQLNENVISVIFSTEMDFFTKLLTFIVIASLFFQVVYLMMPRFLKRKLEKLDYNPDDASSISLTGSLALLGLMSTFILKL